MAPLPAVAVPSAEPLSRAPVTELALGLEHTCALHADGRVSCWGWNRYSQLGVPGHDVRATPVAVPQVSDAIHVAASDGGTCALRRTGELVCWGLQNWPRERGVLHEAPTHVNAAPTAEISGICARSIAGDVSCFTGSELAPVRGVTGATALSAHGDVGCAVIAGGKVVCWPSTNGGERVATAVADVTDAVQVAASYDFACARLRDGRVTCWGKNDVAQLGRGTLVPHAQPAPVAGIDDASQVSVGAYHSCALRRSGTVACWGETTRGAVGTFATEWIAEPQQVLWR